MKLDVRSPIGLMFSLFGLMLVSFGLFSDPAIYERSLGININLWWGVVLLAFGAVMLWLAWRASRSGGPTGLGSGASGTPPRDNP